MFISALDIFKIGIGPSSSHTMGPMTAALSFLKSISKINVKVNRIKVSLHGSLAFTGKGHATDRAVILGLAGHSPETIDASSIDNIILQINTTKRSSPEGFGTISFNPEKDLVFDYQKTLEGHANGMKYFAFDNQNALILEQTYFSIGGGFVVLEQDLDIAKQQGIQSYERPVPHPFNTAEQMLGFGNAKNKSIACMKKENEYCLFSENELDRKLDQIWLVMNDCIERGLAATGTLPGGLNLKRRARKLHKMLSEEMNGEIKSPVVVNEWIALIAMAVNEENAAGGKIVTAPTNGAAGVIPAVIYYCLNFYPELSTRHVREFLLVAAAIGGLIKHNGSISGAEVGCQGEIGSAAAMAAAGMCAVLGGTNEQIENAAEIALEHHLGMTCDPVQGLVQVPCIERNGFGAVKAVTAASLALRGDGSHFVSLDMCIKTMYETGLDMHIKYKETSLGGLAVNMVGC